jgi:hypothetical protein
MSKFLEFRETLPRQSGATEAAEVVPVAEVLDGCQSMDEVLNQEVLSVHRFLASRYPAMKAGRVYVIGPTPGLSAMKS